MQFTLPRRLRRAARLDADLPPKILLPMPVTETSASQETLCHMVKGPANICQWAIARDRQECRKENW